ncbi:DUF305 domain-containing protein [Streptomyces flavalbus]|uniref:DUF305 domain-containing protein n=1 Tax=Streptomyces flavalbus TaxID=2665155 RepID=A0ABW2W792_9ACTN
MPNRRNRSVRHVLGALTAFAVLALGACDSGSDPAPDAASGPSVLVPGKPGEENRTMSAEEAAKHRSDDDTPNSADVSYVRMMIEHHGQALQMTELVPDRAKSSKVTALAERISAAQGPEIGAMEGWLTQYGKDKGGDGDAGGHDHGSMPGMATEAQLKKLRAARGDAFDQLFLTLMITHHEGAITMATDVKAQGNNVRVEEMADDVIAQQSSEITRMRKML